MKKGILPVFLSFFVMGFVDVVGISTSYVKEDFHLSDTLANLLPMMVFVWFAILSIPVGLFQDRYGKKKTLNIGILLTIVAMIIPLIHYSFELVLFSFIMVGISNTIIQVSANPLLHDVSTKKAFSSNMTLSQFVKAIASLLGPIAATWFATSYGNWKLIFATYAVTSLIVSIWLMATPIEEQGLDKKPAGFSSCLGLLKNRYILMLSIAILAIVGVDVGINTNIALIFKSKFGITTDEASIGIKVYFFTLIITRLFSAGILRLVNPKKFLLYSVLFSIIGFSGVYMSPNLWIANISIVIIGLGTANVFPLIFAAAVEKLPERSNEISGLMIMSVCGGAIFPFLMGVVSDSLGSLNSWFVIVLCAAYVLYVAYNIMAKPSK